MAASNLNSHRALFYELDSALTQSLAAALAGCGCSVAHNDGSGERQPADIVFCSNAPASLNRALAQYRSTPVVVVSRLPEVDGWLDALEAGASDYCAAPFEASHLGWLLETNTRSRKALAAA